MKQIWKGAVGLFVVAAIVIQAVPLTGASEVFAKDSFAERQVALEEYRTDIFDDSIFEEKAESENIPYPVAEIAAAREEQTKVFRMSDGSYTAAVYPQPVHFERDGEMQEIDNSLHLVTENGQSFYQNQNAPVQFTLPVRMSALAPIKVETEDGSQLSFVLRIGQGKPAVVAAKPDYSARADILREYVEAEELPEEQFVAAYNKRPYVDGGSQENLHRAGTENIASIVGMAAALKTNSDLLDKNQLHILKLEKQLLARLDESGVVYRCNCVESKLPGLLSLSFPDKDGEAILHRMDLMGISISTGSACDSVNAEISHVLKAIHLAENYAKGTIRISLGKNNTQEDVENIVASLVKIVS